MKVYCTQQGEIQAKKVVPFSLVMDERICDGLYFARAIRLLTKYVKNPELLEIPLEKKTEDVK